MGCVEGRGESESGKRLRCELAGVAGRGGIVRVGINYFNGQNRSDVLGGETCFSIVSKFEVFADFFRFRFIFWRRWPLPILLMRTMPGRGCWKTRDQQINHLKPPDQQINHLKPNDLQMKLKQTNLFPDRLLRSVPRIRWIHRRSSRSRSSPSFRRSPKRSP